MLKAQVIAAVVALLVCGSASARVFNLADRHLGTYVGGTIGNSQLSRQPWGDSSGSTTTSESVRLNYSGEIGVLFATAKMNFRFGVEYLQPQKLSEVKGMDASGNQDFLLKTNTRAIIPKAVLELVVYKTPTSALMFGGSFGYATVTMENNYTVMDAASLGTGNFNEKASGTTLSGEGFVGYEFEFSDNVTVLTSLGYRYLLVNTLKYENNATIIGGTSVTEGSTVRNTNGEARTLNLSSANMGLLFRFYF